MSKFQQQMIHQKIFFQQILLIIQHRFERKHSREFLTRIFFWYFFFNSSTRHINSTIDPNSEQHRKLFIGGLSLKYKTKKILK